MTRVQIGSRVPPRPSMFERRGVDGSYGHAMPPFSADAEALQAGLLNREQPKPRGWIVCAVAVVVLMLMAGFQVGR